MKNLIVIIVALTSFSGFAQQEYSFTHYFELTPYFNPAAAGTEGGQNISGLFRKQWVGLPGSPLTGGVLYDTELEKYDMGLGGFVFADMIGETMWNSIVANYSYSLDLNETQKLSFGLDAGADIFSTNYGRLIYWDDDNMFDGQNQTEVVPHIGTGIQYYNEDLYVGLSVPRLVNFNNNNPLSIHSENLPSIVSNYFLTFGYRFDLNEQFKMQVNTLGKFTPGIMPQGDVNLMATYNNVIGLGVGYKSLGFATAYLEYTYDEVVTVGYAFDFTLSQLANYSSGSHEILIKYKLPNRNKRKGSSASFE